MKKYIPIFMVFSILLGIQACQKNDSHNSSTPSHSTEKMILYYTCPMHPQIHRDEEGKCPICGMDLVPVYEEKSSSTTSPTTASPGHSQVYISPEKQQMIGVRTTKVEQRPIIREIFTTGQIAYHPELFSAQQEYLIALKTNAPASTEMNVLQSQLIEAARLRLLTLGMTESQIKSLRQQGQAEQSLILPKSQGKSWVYASVNESDLAWIKVGTPAQVFIPGASEPTMAQVDSISPMIAPETRSAQIRILISQNANLRPNLYLRVIIQAQSPAVLAIPTEAVLDSGHQQMAFVDLGSGNFEARSIKLGQRGSDVVEVLSGLSLGESVVSSANFLIDSESRLKAAISGMEKTSP